MAAAFRYRGLHVTVISMDDVRKLMDAYDRDTGLYAMTGYFVVPDGKEVLAIDNSRGMMYREVFRDMGYALKWLKEDKSAEDIPEDGCEGCYDSMDAVWKAVDGGAELYMCITMTDGKDETEYCIGMQSHMKKWGPWEWLEQYDRENGDSTVDMYTDIEDQCTDIHIEDAGGERVEVCGEGVKL